MSNDVKLEQMADEAAREAWPNGHDFPEREAFRAGFLAGARHQPQREAILEEAAKACEEQQRIFASPKYAAGQPMSSFGERFGAGRCADAIRALKTTPAPAVSRDEIVATLDERIASTEADVIADREDVETTGERPDLYHYTVELTLDEARTILSRLRGEG